MRTKLKHHDYKRFAWKMERRERDKLWYVSEFKPDVYRRRQTAKITSDFVFFSSNP